MTGRPAKSGFTPLERAASLIEAQREASAHHAGQQRYEQALGQREILDRGLFLLFGHVLRTQRAGIADHGDTCQRDAHAYEQDQPLAPEQVRPGEDGRQQRAEAQVPSEIDWPSATPR